MNLRWLNALALALLVLLLALNSRGVVSAHEAGIRLRQGEAVAIGLPPGAYWRWPLLETLQTVDMRTRFTDLHGEEMIDLLDETMAVDAWVVWNIRDLPRYYRATGADRDRAAALMRPVLSEGLALAYAGASWPEQRPGLAPAVRADIVAAANRKLGPELGIQVLDLGIRRVRFTALGESMVLERMRLAREDQVAALRAEALTQARAVRDAAQQEALPVLTDAEARVVQIEAAARRDAAALIAAEAARDPALARYWQALETWRGGFGKRGDVLVLAEGSELARLRAKLKLDKAAAPAAGAPAAGGNPAGAAAAAGTKAGAAAGKADAAAPAAPPATPSSEASPSK